MVTPQYERIVGGANTSVTLSGLQPGTSYRIRVWSTNGTSVSSQAGEVDVTTVESGRREIFYENVYKDAIDLTESRVALGLPCVSLYIVSDVFRELFNWRQS